MLNILSKSVNNAMSYKRLKIVKIAVFLLALLSAYYCNKFEDSDGYDLFLH